MRKKTLFAASLALMVLMAACTEKEGVYNPKKKISKVYKSSVSHYGQYDPETGTLYNQNTHRQDKQLWEEWIWEGNKLTQIRVYENEIEPYGKEGYAAINFTYDGKQIQRIASADEYMSFVYDGKKLQQIQIFATGSSEPTETYTFTHDGNKITQIDFAFQDIVLNSYNIGLMKRLVLSNIVPTTPMAEKAFADLGIAMAKSSAKAMVPIPLKLTWTGDNITGIDASYTLTDWGGPVACNISGTFAFDDKNNPHQNNFLTGLNNWQEDGTLPVFNKNNVTKSTMKVKYGSDYSDTEEIIYAYTYDGEWPRTQLEVRHYEDEENGYGNIDSTTFYYEYVK